MSKRKLPDTSIAAYKEAEPMIKKRRERNKKQLIGNRYGSLVVVGEVEREYHTSKNGKSRFRYYVQTKCDCGGLKKVETNKLLMGYTKSCGCIVDVNGLPFVTKTHGKSGSREYDIWAGIRSRCYDTESSMYYMYGAVGVVMSDEWKNSFECFYKDMGDAPSHIHSVDRYPNKKGNYCKENCRWATPKEQANNTEVNVLITISGVTKTLSQWCEGKPVSYKTIHARIKYGWPPEIAIFKPLNFKYNESKKTS